MKKNVLFLLLILLTVSICSCGVREATPPPMTEEVPTTEAEVEITSESETETETAAVTTAAETEAEISAETEAPEPQYYVVQSSEIYPNPSIIYSYTTYEIPENSPETQLTPPESFIPSPVRPPFVPTGNGSPSVLMYHLILETPYTELTGLFVRPVDFESQLSTLNSMGYSYLFADEFAETDEPSIVLTFDDGYEDNYTEMFPLLKKYNAKATVFMVTGMIGADGYLNTEQIKEMADSGLVHFGSHTVTHQSLTGLSDDSLSYEFSVSKATLEELTGLPVNSVCYPAGKVNSHVADLASEYYSFGYTTVSSADTSGCDPLLIPRLRVSRGVSGAGLAGMLR